MSADESSAADFIGAGSDFGDGVAVDVGDEDLAAVGLHGQVHWGLPYVEKIEKVVGLFALCLWSLSRQSEHHHLVAARAGDESLRRVGQNDRVSCPRTVGK